MLFANRMGISTFDGKQWNSIQIPTIPYSLKYNPREEKVYVGGDNNYGYLSRDEKGVYRYVSISGDSTSTGIISRIIFTDTLSISMGNRVSAGIIFFQENWNYVSGRRKMNHLPECSLLRKTLS